MIAITTGKTITMAYATAIITEATIETTSREILSRTILIDMISKISSIKMRISIIVPSIKISSVIVATVETIIRTEIVTTTIFTVMISILNIVIGIILKIFVILVNMMTIIVHVFNVGSHGILVN